MAADGKGARDVRPVGFRRRGLPALGLASVVLAIVGVTVSCVPQRSYVALGDSFTAGPLIPMQRDDPLGCLRSTQNYPSLVAPSLALPVFRDPSCSGARTDHMTAPQNVDPGPNPPQFDRLDNHTAIVTLGIGGNDIGFSEIAQACGSLVNAGTPCQDTYVVDGQDEISARIRRTAPKVAAVLQGIRSRSPSARIFVVPYIAILPDSGPGCHPVMPITDGDVPYVRAKQKELNAMLRKQARANGAVYVDAYTPSIGHDACKPPGVKWVEPVVPTSPAAPIHPNLDGMRGVAAAVLAAVQATAAAAA
jgi:hypothetical protein